MQNPPTALFFSNARCTMALVPALAHRDLAVTAFGDFPMADMLSPALTLIDQDPILVGHLAKLEELELGRWDLRAAIRLQRATVRGL